MILTTLALSGVLAVGGQERPPRRIPPPIVAQQPRAEPILPGQADLPVAWGATESPACGGFDGVAEAADCVSAPLDTIAAVAQAYVPLLEQRGFHWVGGESNQYVFARPLGGDVCDMLTMTAFYDTTLQESATGAATGWLGFAMAGARPCEAYRAQPSSGIEAGAAPGQSPVADQSSGDGYGQGEWTVDPYAPSPSAGTPYQTSPTEVPYQSTPQ